MLPRVCLGTDHRRRLNVTRTSVTYLAMYLLFLFLPHFDLFCDKLLNRRAATWNLFLKLRWAWQRWQRSSDYVIILLFKVSYWNIEVISIILTHLLLLLIIRSYQSAREERPIWDITLRKTKVWRFWCRTVTPYSCLEATQQVWRYWITQETSAQNSSISYRACPNYFTMLHMQIMQSNFWSSSGQLW